MGRPASGKPLSLMPIRVDADVRAQVQALRESHATINEGLADIFTNVGQARRGVNQHLEPFARTILSRYVAGGLTEKEVLSNALAVYDTSQTTVHDQVLDDVSAARVDEEIPPNSPMCVHCGARYRGSKRPPFICRACLNGGHVAGLPEDCSECQKGFAA